MIRTIGLSLAMGLAATAGASAQTAEQGEAVWRKSCAACHTLDPKRHKIGPHLAGIVGRRAASADGYPYTEAFRALDLTWTPEAILAFVKAPTRVVPGTKMDYVIRFPDEDAAAVVRFLEAQPPL
jgi:cytochrome c